jgi:hypothetical protein
MAAGSTNHELQHRASISHTSVNPPERPSERVHRQREIREWEAQSGSAEFDPRVFRLEILPLISELPLSDLVRATGLAHEYLSQVRRGDKIPHPRHWPNLRAAGL